MSNQKITAIVPTFDRADFIGLALDSLVGQTTPLHEIIVVNDGSTQDLSRALAPYLGKIRYLTQPNSGKSAAINHGIRESTGDYIWVFDDDDVALPTAVETHCRAFLESPDAYFTCSPRLNADNLGTHLLNVSSAPSTIPDLQRDSLLVALLDHCYFRQPGCVIRRDCFDVVGAFDETLFRSQDYEMLLRLANAFDGVVIEAPTYIQGKHSGLRGPASARHDNADAAQVWAEYDQVFIRKYRQSLPLNVYAKASAQYPSQSQRAAYLRRASIMFGKGLFKEALEDFAAACACGNQALSEWEKQSCLDCYEGRYISHLAGATRYRCVQGISRATSTNREVRSTLATSAYYQAIREYKTGSRRLAIRLGFIVVYLLAIR